MRLDLFLFEKGLVRSRTQAGELIGQGRVFVRGRGRVKNSTEVTESDEIRILGSEEDQYVSRGALKLECALAKTGLDVSGKTCCDIGASTGGFTQVLLLHGAGKVFAVDVGTGQLHPSLLSDNRVVNLENVNARYPLRPLLHAPCDLVVSDVSFISQSLIIPNVPDILSAKGSYLFLVKPQFECGPDARDKRGVVRDLQAHVICVLRLKKTLLENRLIPSFFCVSPVLGGDGNREYLMHCYLDGDLSLCISNQAIEEVIL